MTGNMANQLVSYVARHGLMTNMGVLLPLARRQAIAARVALQWEVYCWWMMPRHHERYGARHFMRHRVL